MYAGYAWLTNASRPTASCAAADPPGRHGRLPGARAGDPAAPSTAAALAFGAGLPRRRRASTPAMFTGTRLGASSRAFLRLAPFNLVHGAARARRRHRGRHRAGTCCGRSPPSLEWITPWLHPREPSSFEIAPGPLRRAPRPGGDRRDRRVGRRGRHRRGGPGGRPRARRRRRARPAAERLPLVGLLRRRRRRAAERALAAAPPPSAAWIALDAFGYAHSACCSASSRSRRRSRRRSATRTTRSTTGPGAARWRAGWRCSWLGDVLFRRMLGIGRAAAARTVAALLAAGHHPAGHRDRRGGPARRARGDPRRGAGRRGRRALVAWAECAAASVGASV